MAKGDYKFDDPKAAFAEAERRIQEALKSGGAELGLNGLGLTELPESIGELKQLELLILIGNRLTTLPTSLIQLKQLTILDLDGNRIAESVAFLGKLTQLKQLYLQENELMDLPDSFGQLVQLRTLWLQGNRLTRLPESLKNLAQLTTLKLRGNDALGLPPELLSDEVKPADILDYYFRVRAGKRALNEAKLILLGRGGVGKTCLIKRLIHDTFDEHEKETPGIEIQSWEVNVPSGDNVPLHVWDFGGQEILHATHQFFLTERTLYLLVLTGREGKPGEDAEYWLQLIRSFGGDSKVIVALNKSVQHPFDVNRGFLLEKYPFIVDFVRTDCENGKGVPDLEKLILNQTDAMEHCRTDFPKDWFAIKERLAEMTKRNEN